ncbi:hypothetical protein Drose_25860 [Dactylosporangium roseum]|uniref:Solute-binding protein family 5 domain-containing protein n=1 Tax=Dactylosporangium roseum TaxID=47989 RepID=A0ABY5Z0R3_9ACTN|nr:ABC transporter substrate-binding protein [Dactylosporangium roseum]UWZ34635.1 hypothetical protein Drose_25860 [Dactylosporangium roseum]
MTAAAVLALTGCSSGGGSGSSGESRLVVAQTADTRSLFANSSTSQLEINISEQVNEKLIEFSADGTKFEPRLAESWEQVDPLTLRVKLRTGVKFTNGEAFNAESAKFSLETMLKANAYKAFTNSIGSIAVVDENTVDVKAASPSDLVLASLAMGSFQYPKKHFETVGEKEFAAAPVGTGPYKFKEWTKGVKITFERNPDYWNGKVGFDVLEFRIIPDPAAQVAALQSGEVDVVVDVPRGSVEQIEATKSLKLATRPSNRIYYATFNTIKPGPLQNPKVRLALRYAVDTNALLEGPLDGHGFPLKGQITSAAFFGHDETRQPTTYDPVKAKQLLAEAGYPNGFEFHLQYSSTNIKEVGQALATQFEAIGLTVKQDLLESGTFLQRLVAKELEGVFYSGSLPPPDSHFMYQQFESTFRYAYYANPKIDELIKQELASADRAERAKIFKSMLDEFDQNPAFIPLFQAKDAYGLNGKIEGFTPRASQFLDVRALTKK